jgi:hypothetical protein
LRSEQHFAAGLKVLLEVFVQPIGAVDNPSLQPLVANAAFMGLQELQGFVASLVDGLTAPCGVGDLTKVLEVFGRYGPFFKIFSSYVSNHEERLEKVEQARSGCRQCDVFLQACEAQSCCKPWQPHPLQQLLNAPLCRLGEYSSFILSLNAVAHGDSQAKMLRSVLVSLEDAKQHVRQHSLGYQQRLRLLQLQRTVRTRWSAVELSAAVGVQASSSSLSTLFAPHRQLIHEGKLRKLCRGGAKPYYLFLFSDCLVYCTARKPLLTAAPLLSSASSQTRRRSLSSSMGAIWRSSDTGGVHEASADGDEGTVDSDEEDTALVYRLIDEVEINIRAGPSHSSATTGSKIERGSTFEVLESRVVEGGRNDGGAQTFLRLPCGGWVFLYHPSKGHALAKQAEQPTAHVQQAAVVRAGDRSAPTLGDGLPALASTTAPSASKYHHFRFRRRFELTDCVVCNAPPSAPSPECSFLVCSPAKSVIFEATSSAARDEWLENIRCAIAAAPSTPVIPASSGLPPAAAIGATLATSAGVLQMAPVWQSALDKKKNICQLCKQSVGVGTRHHCR